MYSQVFCDDEDNDSDDIGYAYSDGKWEWDDEENCLKFIKNYEEEQPISNVCQKSRVLCGTMEFNNELDMMDEVRFKKKIMRKSKDTKDVVTLQDVKDIVLYSSPENFLSLPLVAVLHTATCERFFRALILYCQYYLEIVDIMNQRNLDGLNMIPTDNSEIVEKEFQENLTDLRLLVAKEYVSMIMGAADFSKFHHMGKKRKTKSQTSLELSIYEPLIRMSIQLAWIALHRRSYTLLETEINRLFRSKKFNLSEHLTGKDLEKTYTRGEKTVYQGKCLKNGYILNIHSPLYHEVNCPRGVDYRLFGLGIIKYNNLNERMLFLERYLTKPESEFQQFNMILGIIGSDRSVYDTFLRDIDNNKRNQSTPTIAESKRTYLAKRASRTSRLSRTSKPSNEPMSCLTSKMYLHRSIRLPRKTLIETPLPLELPSKKARQSPINKDQYHKWITRVTYLVRKRGY